METNTLHGIDIPQTLAAHRDAPALYPLLDGRQVVGHVVDEQNHLLYVVREGDELACVHAQTVHASGTLQPGRVSRRTVLAGWPFPWQRGSAPGDATPQDPAAEREPHT
jgi:hypothetical protein